MGLGAMLHRSRQRMIPAAPARPMKNFKLTIRNRQRGDAEASKHLACVVRFPRCQLSVFHFPLDRSRSSERWAAPSCRAHRLEGVTDAKQGRLVEVPAHER